VNEWENYWQNVKEGGQDGRVFWDTAVQQATLEDLARFENHIDRELPLLDLGCGNGGRTRFMAQHFKKVFGLDVSSSAIQLAK
jgi:cyclopropane fatty-acyl-phospholipid synthase-like methyltransferase